MTPDQVHFSRAGAVHAARQVVLDRAFAERIAERRVPSRGGGWVSLHPRLRHARMAWLVCLPMRDDIVLGHTLRQHL